MQTGEYGDKQIDLGDRNACAVLVDSPDPDGGFGIVSRSVPQPKCEPSAGRDLTDFADSSVGTAGGRGRKGEDREPVR